MANSDEHAVESVFLAFLATDASLTALFPSGRVDDDDNRPVSLTVSATKTEAYYERPGCYKYAVALQLASNNADAATLDDLSRRVDACIPVQPTDTTSANLNAPPFTLFSYLRIENEIEGERPIDADTRSRIRIFPVLAELA